MVYNKQLELIFSQFGLDNLYEKYKVPLELHGILDDPYAGEIMEHYLAIYDFHSCDSPFFDEFLRQYHIFNRVLLQNPDLPVDFIGCNRQDDEFYC